MLLHTRTQKNLQSYLASPSSGLAIMGEQGNGKAYLARHIAATLMNAEDITKHPHVHIIDAASVESAIGSVRELQKTIALQVPSQSAVRRVVIIQHFDQFGHEAQNAMLKTLEEPPHGTVFILTIDHPQAVLATIYSRVQTLHVHPVALVDAESVLGQLYNPAEIKKAYQMSSGAAGLLTGLLENDQDHLLVGAIAEAKRLLKEPKHVRVASADAIVKNKELSSEDLLGGMLRILEAGHKQTLQSDDLKAQKQSQRRVRLVLGAMHDLQAGVSQKLVLTRLLYEL